MYDDLQASLIAIFSISLINSLITRIDIGNFENIEIVNSTIKNLKDLAVSVTLGQVEVKVELNGVNTKLTFVIILDDEITIEISFEIISTLSTNVNYELDLEGWLLKHYL